MLSDFFSSSSSSKDEHSNFQPQYAIGIHGYILVYAVTNRFSFNLIKTLNDKILNAVGVDKVPRVLGTQRFFRERSLTRLQLVTRSILIVSVKCPRRRAKHWQTSGDVHLWSAQRSRIATWAKSSLHALQRSKRHKDLRKHHSRTVCSCRHALSCK